ncbi:pirin family protein [Streptomyces sp. DSM 44917]|uniref:Pirin family protein n=1 Tax=Streptomyces boetiae TaxID=3075541 RepID=A0ABU2LHB5_9ACTN|nr:pirin family protein [Streptomyces sp. DSM 44917]MDT0310657.1 pirin family protein [Streptomyces sp. DSM 44917]
MLQVTRSAGRYRGGDPGAGIETLHAFSFGRFYDPDNLRFGALTACNEERLAPGAGFAAHGHRDVEIVTWVLAGELTHEDAAGRATVLRPGDLQRLTAGEGTRHAERNAGAGPLAFVQMWLIPERAGGAPEYEVVRGLRAGTPYALPRTDAALRVLRLAPGERAAVPAAPRAYVHVARGAAALGSAPLEAGDAARLTAEPQTPAEAGAEGAELLVWVLGGGAPPTSGL